MRRTCKGDDQDYNWLWSIGGSPVGTACMKQRYQTFVLCFENGLHDKIKVGTWWGKILTIFFICK